MDEVIFVENAFIASFLAGDTSIGVVCARSLVVFRSRALIKLTEADESFPEEDDGADVI